MNYSREVKNYILITLGFAILFLTWLFHLLSPIAKLLYKYNHLVDYINKTFDTGYSHTSITFFGTEMENIVVLIDSIMVAIVVIVFLTIYLAIKWSIKRDE